jgi:hypothetical protein
MIFTQNVTHGEGKAASTLPRKEADVRETDRRSLGPLERKHPSPPGRRASGMRAVEEVRHGALGVEPWRDLWVASMRVRQLCCHLGFVTTEQA